MINVNVIAYDVKRKIDKTKTWITCNKPMIISRELPYYNYYSLSIKYNPDIEAYDHYILFFMDKPQHIVSHKTIKDDYGRIKIKLNGDFTKLLYIFVDDTNIEVCCVEKYEDSAVYKLNI